MDWARILAYVTGTVDQELLARNEYMAAGPAPNVIRHGIDLASRDRPVPGRCRRRTVNWCRRATSSSSGEARLRTRTEIREPRADRSGSMPMTV